MSEAPLVTVKELDGLIEKLALKNREKDELDEKLTALNKEIGGLEVTCTRYLKELGREDYKSPLGSVKISPLWSVGLPGSDIDKKLFFDWLRDQGIFDKYATVNSKSLQSLYKAEWDEAKKKGLGMEFSLPGIPAPKLFEKTSFKPTKETKKKGSTDNGTNEGTSEQGDWRSDNIPDWT